MLKKAIKIVLFVVVIGLISIQFIRPEKNSGGYESIASFEAETKPTEEVASILKQNCYDCHSNQTQYPWYAEIAPLSFWLDDHIDDGKKHFNVSAWDEYSIKKKEHKLEELVEMVEDGEMPLKTYSLLHRQYSQDDKKLLLQWAGMARLQYKRQLELSTK